MSSTTAHEREASLFVARLAGNLAAVQRRIAAACEAAGRSREAVRLLAVTKYVGAEAVAALARLGQLDVAENYVQWALAKQEALAGLGAAASAGLRWHLIGPLQTNKARKAVQAFAAVHTVDRLRLARVLGEAAEQAGRTLPVYVQLKVTDEANKSGCAPEELAALAAGVLGLPGLELSGLMAIGPSDGPPEAARPAFERAREAHAALQSQLGRPLILSLGMSQDLEVAVACGATEVRIGSALFDGLEPWRYDPRETEPARIPPCPSS